MMGPGRSSQYKFGYPRRAFLQVKQQQPCGPMGEASMFSDKPSAFGRMTRR